VQDNRKHPPARCTAFSCPNQDKPLCHSCITIWEREHAYNFTRWCDPSGAKYRRLARQVGVLRVFHEPPISFQMATLVSPIPRSTVIWFGSLEFMSTGFGYDMILLPVKGPGRARVAPARSKATRRPRQHASPPKKRRGQHRHRPSTASRSSTRARRAVVQESTAPRAETTNTTARGHDDHTTTLGDNALRALLPSTTLLPHGLFASRGTHPFGLDNAAMSLARAICLDAQTYVERPIVLPYDARTQQQAPPAAELLDFSRVHSLRRLGLGRYTLTSLKQ